MLRVRTLAPQQVMLKNCGNSPYCKPQCNHVVCAKMVSFPQFRPTWRSCTQRPTCSGVGGPLRLDTGKPYFEMGNFRVYICMLFLLSLSCATGCATIGSTSSQNEFEAVTLSCDWGRDISSLLCDQKMAFGESCGGNTIRGNL